METFQTNGMFTFADSDQLPGRDFGSITDGSSNTFAIGEFIHRDYDPATMTFAAMPGSMRPWLVGDSGGSKATYEFKGCPAFVERKSFSYGFCRCRI